MCGIAGIIAPYAAKHTPALLQMLEKIKHRGPDATGTAVFDNAALAHARLSIVDLVSGDQPLYGQGNTCVVFNGELYGYEELRCNMDYPFKTTSDTELLPALYQKYGNQFCEKVPGMFAFALWDDHNKRLICARDRFGEKPFFYAKADSGEFIFASELSSLLESGLIRATLNPKAVASYLALRYVPEDMCIYQNIRVLKPGHMLIYENDTITEHCYWTPPATTTQKISLQEASEEFSFLMDRAVRRCMVADVDVGLLLSGGLDSTTIAAIASQQMKLKAFSFGFTGEKNELPYAHEAASMYNLPLKEVHAAEIDFPHLLLTMCRIYGEPFADSSAIPTYLLCQKVREEVKVALSGDGGDELLAGYNYWYTPLLKYGNNGKKNIRWSEVAEHHWRDLQIFSADEIAGFGLPWVSRPQLLHTSGSVDDALRMDVAGFLPSDILKKTDRASMAHGLELRSPFLEKDLAEFLLALPWELKIHQNAEKLVMRRAFEQRWPESIRARRKQGFSGTIGSWMKSQEGLPLCMHYLANPKRKICSLIPAEQLKPYATMFSEKSWLLLVLAVWLEYNQWET
ncbi:asparagine synthase (glutamine-hydrolyzing) [Maridesulfovibrio hydrothermalis]|uniref:asparagine synthase (glutamine-hydrolyzing) n=1 Tax=Maridesulfovibrio hydrothermalis AM13 = DSM 14728 TaxID=1121451 RepID=L0RAJ2_9BACT|nr:asparagine synthase (glutamine-hydrolyzing) [Maridesulfovibrio hydrothermalis]CCO22586.1 Asparagine synthase (Glutamine-hydrolyzing) [Maridesulfovibrio hydrothermalis AM13 = DSM 14728]